MNSFELFPWVKTWLVWKVFKCFLGQKCVMYMDTLEKFPWPRIVASLYSFEMFPWAIWLFNSSELTELHPQLNIWNWMCVWLLYVQEITLKCDFHWETYIQSWFECYLSFLCKEMTREPLGFGQGWQTAWLWNATQH